MPKYIKEISKIFNRAEKLWTDFDKLRIPSDVKRPIDKQFENLVLIIEDAEMELRTRNNLPERF